MILRPEFATASDCAIAAGPPLAAPTSPHKAGVLKPGCVGFGGFHKHVFRGPPLPKSEKPCLSVFPFSPFSKLVVFKERG